MSAETVLLTPKTKKRVTALVAFYEEIGTPTSSRKRSEPETPSRELEQTPSKKRKLKDVELDHVADNMDVVENVVTQEPTEEDGAKPKESRSGRRSRRMKEAVMAKYSKRIFCATEILSTERTYVEALQSLHKMWMQPLSRVLPENDIHRIFGNIVSILRFNETLLGKLERRMKNFDPETTLIGDIFISLVPFLSMYTDYCCNYGEGMALMGRLKADDEDVAAVLMQSLAECGGSDLQDFCITPVQRVPRYRLLLETLFRNTPAEHPDYANLTTAIQLVSDKAAEINKKMNLVEQQKKMTELHLRFMTPPMLKEDLVQPWRYLCAEFGAKVLTVADGEIEETEATFYLFNDIFVIAKPDDPGVLNGKLMVLTGQKLWNCFLKKLEPGWKLAQLPVAPFQVVNPNGVWNLIIDNKQKFKQDFEANRDSALANSSEKKQKRGLIKLFANNETQEWMAVEPAPTYASNRVSTQILAAETTEFTKMALEELLSENREIFESRAVTPAKTPKKSRLGKILDSMTPLKWSSKKAPAPTTTNSNLASHSASSLPAPISTQPLFGSPAGKHAQHSSLASSHESLLQHSTPSRRSAAFNPLDVTTSPCHTPGHGTMPSAASDKENGSDTCNQADIIRSTIAKLSQTSALQKPTIQSSSTPNLASKKKVADSPSAFTDSPVEAKRRRHRKAATTTDFSQVPLPPPLN